MVVAMALSHVRGGRISRWRFVMVLARRSTLSVGSLSGLDSSASIGQWLNCVRIRCVWEKARNHYTSNKDRMVQYRNRIGTILYAYWYRYRTIRV